MINHCPVAFEYTSPFGRMIAVIDNGALGGLWFVGQRYCPESIVLATDMTDAAHCVMQWLDRYFAGLCPRPGDLSLAPRGTDFQLRVWRELCEIPYGHMTTYGDIARRVGSSPRAVGGAIGHNPISVIIPCHRVIGAGGDLTGYAAGTGIKQHLLHHEGIII